MLKRRCPFLGISNDPETVVGFPSVRNHCHRMKSDEPVRPEFQRSHCLTFNHRNCPILLGQSDGPLTADLIVVGPGRRRAAMIAGSVFTVLAAAVIVIFLFGGWQWAGAIDPDGKPAQQVPPELQTAFPPSPTPTASAVIAPSATVLPPTNSPQPTQTPEPTAVPATRRPTSTFVSPTVESTSCGAPSGWVSYFVKTGDTLSSIAAAYGVTVAQLQAANCLTSTVIYVGQELYVPNVSTATPDYTATPSEWGSPTPEITSTPSPTTETPEATATETDAPTNTPIPSDTPEPTVTNTPEPTEMPTSAPTLTPSPLPTVSPTPVSLPPTYTLTP